MLHKIKSSKLRLLRFLFLIPLTALMSLPYACSNESQNSNSKDLETVQEPDANSENQVFDMQTVDVKPSLKDTDASLSDKEKEDLFMKAIFSHITSNFKYPEQAKKDGVQGKVIVNFTIGADGKVADAKVLRGVEASLDQEALKIVESLPEFNPAKVGDKNVPVSFALPITFRLQ